jgi:hypothetical protein
MENFLVIDVSPWIDKTNYSENDRNEVCSQWNAAFERVGFAIIIGHGITGDILSVVTEEARKFFANDLESKMCFHKGPYGNPGKPPRCVFERVIIRVQMVDIPLLSQKQSLFHLHTTRPLM